MWFSAALYGALITTVKIHRLTLGQNRIIWFTTILSILYNTSKNVEVLWIIGLMKSITPCVYHDTVKPATKTSRSYSQ